MSYWKIHTSAALNFENLNIGRDQSLVMIHYLWVQNNALLKSITTVAFDLGTSATLARESGRLNIGCFSLNIVHFYPNIGRLDSKSAVLDLTHIL